VAYLDYSERVSSVERRLKIYIDRNNATHGTRSSTDEEIHKTRESALD
jgi:hypothetical protein